MTRSRAGDRGQRNPQLGRLVGEPGVAAKRGMQLLEDAQRLQAAQRRARARPRPGSAPISCRMRSGLTRSSSAERVGDQLLGAPLDLEPKALLEPSRAQHARRVLHEAQAVKNPDDPVVQILAAAVEIQQLAPAIGGQTDGQRVDREIPAVQVLLDAAPLDRRQRGRMLVELGSGGDEIERIGQAGPPAPAAPRAGSIWRCRSAGGCAGGRPAGAPAPGSAGCASPSTTRSTSKLGWASKRSRTKPPTA